MGRPVKYTAGEAKRAKLENDARRHREKLDRIVVQPYKEEGAKIRQAAANAGESVQKYVLGAVRTRMEAEEANTPKTDPQE